VGRSRLSAVFRAVPERGESALDGWGEVASAISCSLSAMTRINRSRLSLFGGCVSSSVYHVCFSSRVLRLGRAGNSSISRPPNRQCNPAV
jgi:hypothetical protein